MNFLNKKVLLALSFLSFSGTAFGYVWTFTNLTPSAVLIELTLTAYGYTYYDIINPGENSTRFSWPIGSMKAGFCIDKFFIGELNANQLKDLFGKTTFPNADEIRRATDDGNIRAKLARIGKREPSIEWISGEKWGTFDKASKDAVNALSTAVGNVAGEAANLALAAGTEVATGGATAGTAGTAVSKLNLGKIFDSLSGIPGSIMTLAQKTPCASRHFTIIKKDGSVMVATKE